MKTYPVTRPVVLLLARPFDNVLATCGAKVADGGAVLVLDELSGEWTARHDLSKQDCARVIAATDAFLATAKPARFAGRRAVALDDEIQRERSRERDEAARAEAERHDRDDEAALAHDPGAFG